MFTTCKTCLTCQIPLPPQYCYRVGVSDRLDGLNNKHNLGSALRTVPLIKEVLIKTFESSYFSDVDISAGEVCRRCVNVIFKLYELRETILKSLQRRALKSLSSDVRNVSNGSDDVIEENGGVHEPEESIVKTSSERFNENEALELNRRKRKLEPGTEVQGKRRKEPISSEDTPKNVSSKVNSGYKCAVCNKSYRSAEILRRHGLVHSTSNGVDEFRCSDCSRTFLNLAAYQIHVVTHIRKSYICTHCKKVFKIEKNFVQHQKNARCAEKKFPCPTCGKMFKTKDKVKRHLISVHSDIKPFMCPTCGKGFRGASDLKLHEFSAHVCKTGKSHHCNFCGKTYKSSEALKSHKQYAHVLEKKHRCSTCNKGFALLATLKIHQVSHEKDRPYMCTYCGRTYKYAYDLKSHEGTHHSEEEKRFECPVCNAKFHRKDLLRLHQSRENHCGPEEPAANNVHEHRNNTILNASATVAEADHHPVTIHHHVLTTASHGFNLDSNSCFSIGSEGSGNLHIVAENSLTAICNSNDNSVLDVSTSTAPPVAIKEGSQLCNAQATLNQSNYAFTNTMTGNDNISDLLTGMYDIT